MNKVFYLILFLFLSSFCNSIAITDEVADKLSIDVYEPSTYTNYNFESTEKIPIKLKITEDIKSEKDVYEGQIVKFKVVKNVVYKNKILLQRGDIVPAKVGVIISTGMNGIPASIIFKDFQIKTLSKGQLSDTYEVFGQDRSLFVFPLKWALTPLPPTGSLTNFIKGGHVKLTTKEQITIYYYPNW